MGGLINEKIKERKTNIKHLLYLSGSNSRSYWLAFFIIDYLKLLIFSIFIIIPIYFEKELIGYYFFVNFLIGNASSLIFIYFCSFFGLGAKSGTKFLLLLLIVYAIFLILIILFLKEFNKEYINSYINEELDKTYNFTIFDITPITSFLFSFTRLLYSWFFYNERKDPISFLFTSYIIQVSNFVFYFLLLILMETGYLRNFFNWFKLKFCLTENNFIISQNKLSDEFLISNRDKNSLLLNPNNDNFDNYQPIISMSKKKDNDAQIPFINNFNTNNQNSLLGNNIQVNIKTEDNNFSYDNEINNINLNKPLLQNKKNYSIINDVNYESNISVNNFANNIRKDNCDIIKEKYSLNTRNDFTTRIEGLRIAYWLCCKKRVIAINDLNLGFEANEKFGLLGLNGSGKTTTFRAITNEILYDYGKISLFGFDTRKQFKYIRAKIGYCPQENPLFDFMNVREILEFYSNLKTCFFSIEEICTKFGLNKYLDTYCINLSGGNKRKLTFAIAIMNRPTLLLLDEPSTGVDPDSRRMMWRNINELSNNGHRYNMILTTHYIEEAEILCDRVSWLNQGRLVCIGNPEKLKIQYSLGYKLHIKFDNQSINKNEDENNISEAFKTISGLIVGFINFPDLMNNKILETHIKALVNVVIRIKSNTKRIILSKIRKDLSFELILDIIQERKYILFSDILSMKNNDNNISEISISMESLDNIFESFISA